MAPGATSCMCQTANGRRWTVFKLLLVCTLVYFLLYIAMLCGGKTLRGGIQRPVQKTHSETNKGSNRKTRGVTGEELLEIVENGLVFSGSSTSTRALEQVLRILQSRLGEESNKASSDVAHSRSDVCAEVFNASEKVWRFEDCDSVRPIANIVTVLVNGVRYSEFQLVTLLEQIREHYPTLKAVVAVGNGQVTTAQQKDVEFVMSDKKGSNWVKILHKVKTKYSLVLPIVNRFTNYTNIERLVSVASRYNISFVGGASVGMNGHWWNGCHKVSLKNYRLRYIYGYDVSRDSCMFCDHLEGPFLALTTELTRRLSDAKHDGNVFENLFLSMTSEKIKSAVCPDVMFHVEAIGLERQFPREHWVSLAKKHSLNEIVTYSNQTFMFTCAEVDVRCPDIPRSRGRLQPPCCLKQIQTCSHVMLNAAKRANITLELGKGTLLCALKMRTDCPWDLDLDTIIIENQLPRLRDIVEKDPAWAGSGCKFINEDTMFRGVAIDSRHFTMWHVDVFKETLDSSVLYSKLGYNNTQVLYGGQWVGAPPNPGLAARERYVNEIYQHAEHFTHSPKSTKSRKNRLYIPSDQPFLKCPHPGKHYCLDQYTGDGSLQFENC